LLLLEGILSAVDRSPNVDSPDFANRFNNRKFGQGRDIHNPTATFSTSAATILKRIVSGQGMGAPGRTGVAEAPDLHSSRTALWDQCRRLR
jgi:hypothetical protein